MAHERNIGSTNMKLRRIAKKAIQVSFEFPSRKHNSKPTIKEANYGLWYEEPSGVIELWWKRSDAQGVKLYMPESTTYGTRIERNHVIKVWKRKYNMHLYPKNFYLVMIPHLKIDEEEINNQTNLT